MALFFVFRRREKKSAESDRKKTVRGTILNAYYFNSIFRSLLLNFSSFLISNC